MTDFTATRAAFDLPAGLTYLDGNSLGPLPRAAADRAARVIREEWGGMLITAWNRAGWMAAPDAVGDRVARLIGAQPGSVTMGDTLSIKLFQALSAALSLRPDRRVILTDSGNFPSDLYMAQGLCAALDKGHVLRSVAPQDVADSLTDDVAAVMLTHVDYRTGRMHDMAAITRAAQARGAVMIWDLAHSAGAVALDLAGVAPEFAVGCSYKYLNGGPGAPAFIHVRPDVADHVAPMLSGWLGHAAPFEFTPDYRPAPGVGRMRIGTPPVIQMAVLDAALDVWDGVDMGALRAQSVALSSAFIDRVEAICPELRLASPRDPEARGSQVSFACEEGYAVMQALIAEGVVGDFRAPDLIRFGFAPLYNTQDCVDRAAQTLAPVLRDRLWDQPQFRTRAAVT